MKKIFIVLAMFVFFLSNTSKAEDAYMFGGVKLFNYGIESSDLQVINTSLVSLGFSSSLSTTDNTGVGFDLGIGLNLDENLALEFGYVNFGTLEINTTLTGPAETVKTEITGNAITGAGVFKFGDDQENFYLKAGMHSWDLDGKVTASLGSSTAPLGTGTDLTFGAGFKANNWFASYDYYAVEEGDFSSFGIGYSTAF
ncbi:hypothetical protein OAC96_05505 [Candidatus Pelagibacter sp.]|jgi:hypothetical protein|nr:hypothetical protein [Candidatus Pelagibacter sp.]